MGTLSEFNDAIGVTGRDAIDGLFPDAAYDVVGEKVLIHLPHRTHLVKTDGVAKPGAKIPGAISPELWADVGCERVGGSGPNSCMAAKLAAPDVPFRYLDTCDPDEQVGAYLARPCLETMHLGLERVSTNVLLGAGNNRLIIKHSNCHTRAFTPDDLGGLRWLTLCKCIRANSVKTIEVAEYLAQQAMAGQIELHVVPTPYLPPDFVSRWLAAASEVCTSQDEIGRVMGWDVDQSLAEVPALIRRLRPLARRAIIVVTRGNDGLVVSMPDQAELVHIRLERNWEKVQEYVSKDPTVLCGAGDACAMGSTLQLQVGRSVVNHMDGAFPAAVKAGIAGSALALRWIGWMPSVSQKEFFVRRIPVRVRVAA